MSGRWLVKAILATLAAAAIALYLTVCLLFYHGQWQFVFFPPKYAAHRKALHIDAFAGSWMRRVAEARGKTPMDAAEAAALSGLPIHDQPFDTTQEGVNLLNGWWIPAAAKPLGAAAAQSDPLASMVLVYFPDGRSDLPQNVPAFRAFHAMGMSVFGFDYQGFGRSQPGHPSEQKAYADGVAALEYLIGTRHIAAGRIVVYGAEVGAAVAARAAQQFPGIAGLILENPQPSLAKEVKREQHIRLLPMWLVFSHRFDIAEIVPTLKMPKLVVVTPGEPEYAAGAAAVYDDAVAPKQKVKIGTDGEALYADAAWQDAVSGFLKSAAAR